MLEILGPPNLRRLDLQVEKNCGCILHFDEEEWLHLNAMVCQVDLELTRNRDESFRGLSLDFKQDFPLLTFSVNRKCPGKFEHTG